MKFCIPIQLAQLVTVLLIALISVGCTNNAKTSKNIVASIDLDEIDGHVMAQEFARLCLEENRSISQLVEFAKSDGWQVTNSDALKQAGLAKLKRTMLEIPGGGGRYRETQSILSLGTATVDLIANMMERFDRGNNLVRTECTLYSSQTDYLPVCAAIGTLLNGPPQSNKKFPHSNSHFIRWSIEINQRPASVRCDAIGIVSKDKQTEDARHKDIFTGITISMIVDQDSKSLSRRPVQSKSSSRQLDR